MPRSQFFQVVVRCGIEIAWKLPVSRNAGAFCSFLPLGLVKVIGPVKNGSQGVGKKSSGQDGSFFPVARAL